jgi:SAM-dependent methyltransferase
LPDGSYDVAVIHRVLSHAPAPERLLGEAFRILRPGRRLAVFDGDYATITLATGEHDPLQVCVTAMVSAFVNDPWVVRRLPAMVEAAGFADAGLESHGFVQITDADYMVSIADRGIDTLAARGRIGRELADALKAEARRRVEGGSFFGQVAYASLIAGMPRVTPAAAQLPVAFRRFAKASPRRRSAGGSPGVRRVRARPSQGQMQTTLPWSGSKKHHGGGGGGGGGNTSRLATTSVTSRKLLPGK